ncbi:MAG: phytanoyl-CoA dioxygenase family protein [Candidatus Thiodiazotropha endolucinida]|nr:phytanoyl-CoA dioxygenase family protein [Candidatus Thiodiazotropha endolucinida]
MVKKSFATKTESSTPSKEPRFADTGFTDEEWHHFEKTGLIIRRGVFKPSEVEVLRANCQAFETIAAELSSPVEGGFRHTLAVSPDFTRLVCDQRLLGLAYDIFGEMTALHSFDLFIRPPGGEKEHPWHIDGPRRLPYAQFSSALPHVLKIGIWLTDVEEIEHSAYQYVPGSHLQPCVEAYGQSRSLRGQETLRVRAGDISVHHCDLWHHVTPNRGPRTRYNFFIAYSPSWISPREPFDDVGSHPDLPLLETLLRRYKDLTHRFKPPADEIPVHPNADSALMQGSRFGRPPIASRPHRRTKND